MNLDTTEALNRLNWELKAEIFVDEFSYTLKRFNLLDRIVRSSWGTELEVFLLEGKEGVESYRKWIDGEEYGDNYN